MRLNRLKNGVSKKGSICMLILPVALLVMLVIVITIIVTYFQISTQIYDVKMNVFNIVIAVTTSNDFENISYRDYSINENIMKKNIEEMLNKNYIKDTNKKRGVVKISCDEVKILNKASQIITHKGIVSKTPIVCVNTRIEFCPIISLLGRNKEVMVHSDVKLSLLEFD